MLKLVPVVWLVLALASAGARADEAVSAREHYNRGSSLFDLGRFGEAAREFEAAYEAKNDPALLYNLGQAYRADGNYQKALLAYKSYLRKSPDQSHREDVQARIVELQSLIEEQKRVGQKPPTGTIAPSDGVAATATAPPATKPAVATPADDSSRLVATAPARQPSTPVYKKWWLWTVVGVVAAGAAAGVAVAVTTPKDAPIPGGATQVMFH